MKIVGEFLLILLTVMASLVACLVGGYSDGHTSATRDLQQQAIKAGVAEWRVDPQTGAVRFEWRKP